MMGGGTNWLIIELFIVLKSALAQKDIIGGNPINVYLVYFLDKKYSG